MDWLDEKLDKIKVKIINLSLRKSIIFYMIFFILLVISFTFVTYMICNHWDSTIWLKYNKPDMEKYPLVAIYHYEDYSKLSDTDRVQVEIIDFIQTWSVFFYSIAGILGASYLFYKNKLKKPLQILNEAAEKIGRNDLDIEIQYDIKDEMGKLCGSFETMRMQLIENNKKMWDIMEEQKRLNAAFAHDLRTPLTVLKGYTDFLNQYIPQGKVNEEKLISTLSLMSNHLDRLERYSNTMKEINSLDEMPVHQTVTDILKMAAKLNDMIAVLDGRDGIAVMLAVSKQSREKLYLDEAIVFEVVENLLSNALRYAKSIIKVMLEVDEELKQLLITVNDDGKGFSMNDLSMAAKPYYKDSREEKSYHFGIGLYICKLLCEKHGGSLALANSVEQGAIVTASFSTVPLK